MKPIRQLVILLVIGVLLSACGGNVVTETAVAETPTLMISPVPYPTDVPTSIPSMPSSNGFPYAPVLSDELPKDGLVLAAHVYTDDTCYDLGIYQDDTYLVLSCLAGFTYPVPNGVLGVNESSYLQKWVTRFHGYDEPSAHGLFQFVGNGAATPDTMERLSIERLVLDLEYKAHDYVSGGGLSGAVLVPQRGLALQLGIPLDSVTILKFEVADFPDACLGAPKPDEVCAQIVTQGMRVQLVAQGMLYEFHNDFAGYDIRQFGEPQIAPTQGAAG